MSGEKSNKKLHKWAKDRHRQNLLSYLSVWENEWPKNQIGMAKVLGIKPDTLRFHFTPAEINEIYSDGLELRKKNSFRQRKSVYDSMLKEAENGNTTAQNNFLDRTEGKITDKHEITGKDGGPIEHVGMDMSGLKQAMGKKE